jgi:hypothetical protein
MLPIVKPMVGLLEAMRARVGLDRACDCRFGVFPMAEVTYEIVQHDGGWAYKMRDVFSETFATRDEALRAAKNAAIEQRAPGETGEISYQDDEGRWHDETSRSGDRPSTVVKE